MIACFFLCITQEDYGLTKIFLLKYPVSQELPSGKKVQADQQSQSIAYSLDEGETWTTYDAENPVIHNPPSPYEAEFENFRDPFVFWHEETQKWVAVTTLASLHKLLIWSSDNLREWSLSSEFGPYNAVGGVWECPNLFQVPVEGAQSAMKWVMVLGLNPGGPPGTVGSGTQYFVGDFNGTSFNPDPASIYPGNDTANWMDWGPDFYAAAGYNGLPSGDVVQIGWMNNWQYGVKVPTNPWRSAMTVPRRLSLKMVDEKVTVLQQPHLSWREVVNHQEKNHWESVSEGSTGLESPAEAFMIDLSFSDHDSDTSLASTFAIAVRASSDFKQETLIGYNFTSKEVFVDRRRSGDISFDNTFGSLYHAPLLADSENRVHLQIFVDWSSVEVLGGQGEVSLTAQIFPDENSTGARLVSVDGKTQDVRLQINGMSSTWH
jgi:levanase/fructan beta-fructosidase